MGNVSQVTCHNSFEFSPSLAQRTASTTTAASHAEQRSGHSLTHPSFSLLLCSLQSLTHLIADERSGRSCSARAPSLIEN
eukprot:3597130-Amphidinium_carterae.1